MDEVLRTIEFIKEHPDVWEEYKGLFIKYKELEKEMQDIYCKISSFGVKYRGLPRVNSQSCISKMNIDTRLGCQ